MNKPSQASVTASLSFDFRGQTFKPAIEVDLHQVLSTQQDLNNLHHLLAASIGLDVYRHEYDVLIMQEIIFSQATGLAREFISDGKLDFNSFIAVWQQQQVLSAIHPIAQQHLDISDLSQHENIRKALIASYQAGQKNIADHTQR